MITITTSIIIILRTMKPKLSKVKGLVTVTEVKPAIRVQLCDSRKCLVVEDDDICCTYPPFKAVISRKKNQKCQRSAKIILLKRTVRHREIK